MNSLVKFIMFASLFLPACAARLPQTLGVPPRPRSAVRTLDLSQIKFHWLAGDRSEISLADYMNQTKHDYLLLTFGSKGCAACNRKATQLTKEVINQHPIYLTPEGKKFEIMGINTDPDPERLASYLATFPFIRWSDPEGGVMVSYFIESDESFRVPLTVLVSRQGIVWRIKPDDKVSVADIMTRVQLTLASGIDPGSKNGEPNLPPTPPPSVPTPPDQGANIAQVLPARLNGVSIHSCQGESLALGAKLNHAARRIVQVVQGACGTLCKKNHQLIQSLKDNCPDQSSPRSNTCEAATLVVARDPTSPDSPLSLPEEVCRLGDVYQGGGEIWQTFKALFDWRYPRELSDTGFPRIVAPPGEQSATLVFDQSGTLILSQEGELRLEDLNVALAYPNPQKYSRGADFLLFNKELKTFHFADWRMSHRYTVVAGWQTDCGSCEVELKHWSAPGQLVDFCASSGVYGDLRDHGDFCQISAIENRYPGVGDTLDGYFDKLTNGYGTPRTTSYNGFKSLGIRVPLLLDPTPDGPGSLDYLQRIHDGYMIAVTPELENDYRTFIYNREGQVVKVFRSEAPTPGVDDSVLEFLKHQL